MSCATRRKASRALERARARAHSCLPMSPYNNITILENRRRCRDLERFKSLVHQYETCLRGVPHGCESGTSEDARSKINYMRLRIRDILASAGVNPVMTVQAPPIRGSRVFTVHLIQDIFQLGQFGMGLSPVKDIVELAIGRYRDDWTKALVRTFNPLFWVGRILDLVASTPILVLGKFGVQKDRLEASVLGRVLKGAFWLAGGLVPVLTLLQMLGVLERLKNALGLGVTR